MTAGLDPHRVPASPVHSVILSAAGEATVNGGAVVRLPGHDIRMAVVADLRRRAAFRGRPVRATVKEVDGTTRYLIVGPDGDVLETETPHAPVPPAQSAPVPSDSSDAAQPKKAEAPAETALPTTSTAADAWREHAIAQLTRNEQHARTQYGPDSPQAQHWARLRSGLVWGGPLWEAAAELWISALDHGLATEPANSARLRAWAQDAVRTWTGIDEPQLAASIAPRLHAVLRRLDNSADLITAVEQHLDNLHATSALKADR
ncbi:hypothetical protein ABZ569_32200 [Streptomyces albus]|uniref:hypothetical protein n=1 Tax=Streptomyces albus TaxID=1888 RepID=UPI0033DED390